MADTDKNAQPQEGGQTLESNEFEQLLYKEFRVKPEEDERKTVIDSCVRTLAETALEHATVVPEDSVTAVQQIIAALDEKLSEQVNQIIHAPGFRELEGAWRGLHHLVNNSETDQMLKIRVMNVSKKDLHKTLRKYKGTAWDQSPIFKKVYEAEYGVFGGEPFGCLVGDYHFDHSPQDTELLGEMSQVAAAAHSPFIAGASPNLFRMDSWSELSNPRDLAKIVGTPEHASWNSLRDSEDSRYVALAMPRFLARLPYGAATDPVEEFSFEEDTSGADHDKYVWANSAYAMAVNINRSFKEFGWCARIRGVTSGGAVDGLPTHTFPTDDGGVDMKCPTEIAITDRREKELADLGLMPLCHKKNTDLAAFFGAQTLQRPAEYTTEEASANAQLSARLPYLFSACRFAHYLKAMVRDTVGSFKEKDELRKWLRDWVLQYVLGNPESAPEAEKARRPLAEADVVVEEDPSNPGYYSAKFFLRPHYQLEGLTASLRLVSRLPNQ